MTDLDDRHQVRLLNLVYDAIVADAQSTCAPETIALWHAELDGIRTQLSLGCAADLAFG
jgi:hypothetical protein